MSELTPYTPISNESFNEWLSMAWQNKYQGSSTKLMRVGPDTMRFYRWIAINCAYKYRRGKSGKLIVRRSKYYDFCMDLRRKFV